MGYYRAGFEVVGVDLFPQPRFPFTFVQADALKVLRELLDPFVPADLTDVYGDFAVIHASPPCQAYSVAGALRVEERDHPDLVGVTRCLLQATKLPWVIENVPGAPLVNPVQLCGTSFGLGWTDWELRRHRRFESNVPLKGTSCVHTKKPSIPVVGHGATKATRERLGRNPRIEEKRAAMGIDWMNRNELSEAIPPAYTEYVGRQLLDHIERGGSDSNRTHGRP